MNRSTLPVTWLTPTVLVLFALALQGAPVVDAGPDTTVRLGAGFSFHPVVSVGDPPTTLTTQWTVVDGPEGGAEILFPDARRSAVEFAHTGVYLFALCATGGQVTVCDTFRCTVLDSIPFVVRAPAAGAQIRIGSACTISWQLDPPVPVTIELSLDGGKSYRYIAQGQIEGSSWVWHVDSALPASPSCIIRVAEYFNFERNSLSGSFSLVSPNSGVIRLERRGKTGQSGASRAPAVTIDGREYRAVRESAAVPHLRSRHLRLPNLKRQVSTDTAR